VGHEHEILFTLHLSKKLLAVNVVVSTLRLAMFASYRTVAYHEGGILLTLPILLPLQAFSVSVNTFWNHHWQSRIHRVSSILFPLTITHVLSLPSPTLFALLADIAALAALTPILGLPVHALARALPVGALFKVVADDVATAGIGVAVLAGAGAALGAAAAPFVAADRERVGPVPAHAQLRLRVAVGGAGDVAHARIVGTAHRLCV